MRQYTRTLFAAIALLTGKAYADTDQTGAASENGALQEIVVTAQKRSENLQRVPIVVTSVPAETLTDIGVENTQELAFAVPGLVYSKTGAYAQPYLRGIGSELTLPNADPSVTTYLDGVVVSTTAGIIQQLLGVKDVQVLEGPQGTLYGRNATAGAINITTLTPSQTPQESMTVTFGNYARKEVSGYASGGIGSNLAVGIYAAYTDRNTYLTQITPGAGPTSEINYGVRLKAVWTPTDAVTLTGSVEYTDQQTLEGGAFRNVEYPDFESAVLHVPNAVQPPYTINNTPQSSYVYPRVLAATLREEVDFGWAKLLGISGLRRFEGKQANDLDGSPVEVLEALSTPERSTQESQELQLISPDTSAIQWIAGLFYMHEDAGLFPVTIGSTVILPAPVTGSNIETGVALNSYAGFAQTTIPLDPWVPKMRVTLGARFTHDEKTWNAIGYYTEGDGVPLPGSTDYPSEKASWNNVSPKATIDYQIADDTFAYATFAEGYKAGAFNLSSPALKMPPAVSPEKLRDFEGGLKSEVFEHRLRLNGDAYFYNYKDIQTSVIEGGSNGVTSLQNAGSARLYGLEVSATARVTQEFQLTANMAYEHSYYTSFPNFAGFILTPLGNADHSYDVTGNETPRAPKWVGSLIADYKHNLGSAGTLSFTGSFLYNGGFYWEETNQYRQPGYGLLNLHAAYTTPDEHWSVALWGDNVNNKFYETGFEILPTAIGVMDAPPRMFGASFTYKR